MNDQSNPPGHMAHVQKGIWVGTAPDWLANLEEVEHQQEME